MFVLFYAVTQIPESLCLQLNRYPAPTIASFPGIGNTTLQQHIYQQSSHLWFIESLMSYMASCLRSTQPIFLGWVFAGPNEGIDIERLHQGRWYRRDIITTWCSLITIFWTLYLKTPGFLASAASKVTFWDKRGMWEHLAGDGSIMKKYREYPAADLQLPFVKNLLHQKSAYGVIKNKDRKSG